MLCDRGVSAAAIRKRKSSKYTDEHRKIDLSAALS